MTLTDYLHLLRKRVWMVAASTLVALAGAAAIVLLSTPKYEATTQLFVSANDTGSLASDLQQGSQFSQSRVQSYAEIVNTEQITDPVAAQLNAGLTGKQISKEISATAPLNTVLLNVHVTDTSPARAQRIANAVSQQFATYAAELEASAGGKTPPIKVTVVKPATLPTTPVSPKVALDLGLGLLIGLGFGIGGAVVRETLDNTVKTGDDVQEATDRPTIGVIAFDPDAKTHPLVVIDDLHGTRAEAFRQLRTNLQFVDVDTPLRSIVCTSSVPGEGKTTTICNLAITLAHTGMRVLLMEADLRRPRVGLYMGLDSAVGLTSVLIGAVSFDDAVQHWGPEGLLDILPSGPTPPNPSELLGSRGMADLLRSLEQRYDIVLLDAPPLLPVTDAAVLAVETSGAVLVVHHGKTRREQLENSAVALSAVGARILGTVINFAPRKGPEAYYYGYAYSYRKTDEQPSQAQHGPAVHVAPTTATGQSRGRPGAGHGELNGGESAPAKTNAWPNGPVLPEDLAPARPPVSARPEAVSARPEAPAAEHNENSGTHHSTPRATAGFRLAEASLWPSDRPASSTDEQTGAAPLRPYATGGTSESERARPGEPS